jgi:hypothetical protein
MERRCEKREKRGFRIDKTHEKKRRGTGCRKESEI